ncbi:hypothetical protein [Saccharopolyspora gregorii]|uniref:hypothetical protein n=1 Tax=Saccharopolyspora gregorii TaxID=33914 RepID=UPI0031E73235
MTIQVLPFAHGGHPLMGRADLGVLVPSDADPQVVHVGDAAARASWTSPPTPATT